MTGCNHLSDTDPAMCLERRRIAFFQAGSRIRAINHCENCPPGIERERQAAKVRQPDPRDRSTFCADCGTHLSQGNKSGYCYEHVRNHQEKRPRKQPYHRSLRI
jgi:hypothetical protein